MNSWGRHHLQIRPSSYPINTNMTGLRLFSKIFASLCFGRKYSLSIGRVKLEVKIHTMLRASTCVYFMNIIGRHLLQIRPSYVPVARRQSSPVVTGTHVTGLCLSITYPRTSVLEFEVKKHIRYWYVPFQQSPLCVQLLGSGGKISACGQASALLLLLLLLLLSIVGSDLFCTFTVPYDIAVHTYHWDCSALLVVIKDCDTNNQFFFYALII